MSKGKFSSIIPLVRCKGGVFFLCDFTGIGKKVLPKPEPIILSVSRTTVAGWRTCWGCGSSRPRICRRKRNTSASCVWMNPSTPAPPASSRLTMCFGGSTLSLITYLLSSASRPTSTRTRTRRKRKTKTITSDSSTSPSRRLPGDSLWRNGIRWARPTPLRARLLGPWSASRRAIRVWTSFPWRCTRSLQSTPPTTTCCCARCSSPGLASRTRRRWRAHWSTFCRAQARPRLVQTTRFYFHPPPHTHIYSLHWEIMDPRTRKSDHYLAMCYRRGIIEAHRG